VRSKLILFNSLQDQPKAKTKCEKYSSSRGFRNLDHMLEYLVYESPFAAQNVNHGRFSLTFTGTMGSLTHSTV
jgi:hypothetical protein